MYIHQRNGKDLKCQGCGNYKYVSSYRIKSFKYCSYICRQKRVSAICHYCNADFVTFPSTLKAGWGRFCSAYCRDKFKVGKPSWNKGVSGYMAGQKHYNWKGGITPGYKLERQKMKAFKKAVFTRDNWHCIKCGSSEHLNAHHIKPWKEYPNLRFMLDNVQTLCADCHFLVTFGRNKPKQTAWGVGPRKVSSVHHAG